MHHVEAQCSGGSLRLTITPPLHIHSSIGAFEQAMPLSDTASSSAEEAAGPGN